MTASHEQPLDPHFLHGIRAAVRTMREAGMNDTLIGWVVYEIRARAIQSETMRLENLRQANPPSFRVTGFEIAEVLPATADESDEAGR